MAEIRVLVVEDERRARELLVAILEADGYEVLALEDGEAALTAAETFRPDLALLDCALPGSNGVDVARRLRHKGDVPIIFVTGADSTEDIRDGFRVGADDYIVKPYDSEELSFRVKAVLRRSGHSPAEVWEVADMVVDDGARTVTRSGNAVNLTATEFQMLGVLVRNRGRVVPKTQLIAQIWGYDADHVLDVHMSSLRRKLEAHGPRLIHTVRGVGFVLREERRAVAR